MTVRTLAAAAAEQPDRPITPDALRTLAEHGDPAAQHILGLAYLHRTHAAHRLPESPRMLPQGRRPGPRPRPRFHLARCTPKARECRAVWPG